MKGQDSHIKYDSTVVKVKVEVKDNGEGQLIANVVDGDKISFHNVYSKSPVNPENPDKPDTPANPDKPANPGNQDVPKTGDTANVGLWIGLVAIAAIIVVIVVVRKKKK